MIFFNPQRIILKIRYRLRILISVLMISSSGFSLSDVNTIRERLVISENKETTISKPIAEFLTAPLQGTQPLLVKYDKNQSANKSETIAYEWFVGNRSKSSDIKTTKTANVGHTYSEPSAYIASSSVKNDIRKYADIVNREILVKDDNLSPPATIRINEFLTKNMTGFTDKNGEREDWIELYNYGTKSVNLLGWCLTDDATNPAQWCFKEDVNLMPGAFLVVISGGEKNSIISSLYRTNFKLKSDGEYLGLYGPHSDNPVDFYKPYPPQRADQSYGKLGHDLNSSYLVPTPNAKNRQAPSRPSDKLRFNIDSLTTIGDARIVQLSTDSKNKLQTPYTLEVSEPWLLAEKIRSDDALSTDNQVKISVNTTDLMAGSYVGSVTARVDGFEETSITVNLLVPHTTENVTDWEMADVRIAGLPLLVDAENNRVFYSIGPGYSSKLPFTGALTYDKAAGYSVGFDQESVSANDSLIDFSEVSYASQMSVELYKNGELISSYQLILTNLPVVAMKAEDIVDEPGEQGIFKLVSGELDLPTFFYNMKIEFRGGTAQRYPKKSFKLEFLDSPDLDTADALNVQFQALRRDDDWILDASYRDTSFVRNLVSMDLWNEMRGIAYVNERGVAKGQPALRGQLVEVILNNQYQGVHVLQETLDRKLLDLDKGTESALFKGVSSLATLGYFDTARTDFEQKYPDFSEIDNYSALEELIDFVNQSSDEQFVTEIGSFVDIDSAVDYWLLNLVTMATDNLRKNYFIYRNNNGRFYFAPWDFDATFGMHWFGGEYSDHAYWRSHNVLISRLMAISPEFHNKLIVRWQALKTHLFTVRSLSDQFQKYLSQLVPIENDTSNAFTRNKSRWPDSGVNGKDFPELGQIEWIRNWISNRLKFIDSRIKIAK